MTTQIHNIFPALQRYTELFRPEALNPTPYIDSQSRKTLVLVPPLMFQSLAFPLSYGEKHKMKEDRTDAAKGQWNELPYLSLKIDRQSDECQVMGHEGRHRTIWMTSHDVQLIPVVFWVITKFVKEDNGSKTKIVGDDMEWGPQDIYRPKFIRSQNKKLRFPMPQSLVFPKALTT